jgi:hypothetical protein
MARRCRSSWPARLDERQIAGIGRSREPGSLPKPPGCGGRVVVGIGALVVVLVLVCGVVMARVLITAAKRSDVWGAPWVARRRGLATTEPGQGLVGRTQV